MINNLRKARQKVVKEMACQGKHHQEHELFFNELWEVMRNSFTEENDTTTASFILEKFLSVLPLKKIDKSALISCIEEAYEKVR